MNTCASVSSGRRRKLNGSYSPSDAKSLASRGSPASSLRTLTLARRLNVTVLPSAVVTVTSCGLAKTSGWSTSGFCSAVGFSS